MNAAPARRSVLGAAFATMAVGALPAAAVSPAGLASTDPIFPALAAWEAADCAVIRVYAATSGDDSPAANALCDAEDARRDVLEKALNATTPTTLPGLAALARHYAATSGDPDGQGLTHLAAALSALARASPS